MHTYLIKLQSLVRTVVCGFIVDTFLRCTLKYEYQI